MQALRNKLPSEVRFIVGRVTDIESGPISTVHLDDGQAVAAKLVVMATGLNTKLGKRLGVDYEMISAKHSTTVGFDIRSPKCTPAETSVLVYYGNDLQDGVDYLTVCNCSPPFVQSFLDTVTAGSIHDGAWTEQPLSPFPAMT